MLSHPLSRLFPHWLASNFLPVSQTSRRWIDSLLCPLDPGEARQLAPTTTHTLWPLAAPPRREPGVPQKVSGRRGLVICGSDGDALESCGSRPAGRSRPGTAGPAGRGAGERTGQGAFKCCSVHMHGRCLYTITVNILYLGLFFFLNPSFLCIS